MPTIIYIHGGNIRETAEEYRDYLSTTDMHYKAYPSPTWPERLSEKFPDANIIAPRMPRKQRAQYDERKLWMDRCLEFITPDKPVIWIGRSLGALFLAKYLSDHPQKVDQLDLIAGIYYPSSREKFTDDRFPSGFDLPTWREAKLSQYRDIHLRHSDDDPVVDYENSKTLSQKLPTTNHILHTLSNRGHIRQPDFPELREEIRTAL